ncbi:MAG: hypothetical protein II823_04310 [Kiritimatiellae bacterium]|nr:hypothetical protein [Kiritimatiellia bacterium]
MKLLYMWINDHPPFDDFSLNFHSGYSFSVEKKDAVIRLICKETGCVLPIGFFKGSNGACDIDVSAVVGKNASGKTSVARYLELVRSAEDGSASFDYLIVYEKGSEWFVQWYDSNNQLAGGVSTLELPEKPTHITTINQCKGGACDKNDALWNFEFAYYSPHFTTENQFLVNSPAMENLSTNGIMYGGFEEQMNRPYDLNDHQSIQKNYLAVEHRMGLTALRNIPHGDDGINLPRPKEIVISIHSVEYQENKRWLSAQKKRLAQALEEEKAKDGKSAIVAWLQGRIRVVEVLERSGAYYADSVHAKRSFVLRAFIALVYTYIRISGLFSDRYNILTVDYAEYLVTVLLNVVLQFVCNENDNHVFKAHYKLVSALRRGVRLRGQRPGDVAEEYYPNELEERRSLTRVFVRLAKWCKCAAAEEHQSSIDELHVKFKDADKFSNFFDSYVVAMNRFDFLSFAYQPVMSSGDMSFLSMFARLYDYLMVMKESRSLRQYYAQENNRIDMPVRLLRRSFSPEMVVFLDEAETTLHPERQRDIVVNIIKFFDTVGLAESVHVIFATHSPMILSDVPMGNIVLLSDLIGAERKKTFGANIFDLYRHGFVLKDGTVGSFAQKKIDDLVEKVFSLVRNRGKSDKRESITVADRQLVDLIADKNVARYLREWLKELDRGKDLIR